MLLQPRGCFGLGWKPSRFKATALAPAAEWLGTEGSGTPPV